MCCIKYSISIPISNIYALFLTVFISNVTTIGMQIYFKHVGSKYLYFVNGVNRTLKVWPL